MVANKMTGEKGVLFTAAYVAKFEEMERSINQNLAGLPPHLQALAMLTQQAIETERRINEVKTEVSNVEERLSKYLNSKISW